MLLKRPGFTLIAVLSVSLAKGTGLDWLSGGRVRAKLPEETPQPVEEQLQVEYQEIAPRFCETLKFPLLEGREFIEGDRPGAPRVAVINETLARRLWPEVEPPERTLIIENRKSEWVNLWKPYGKTFVTACGSCARVPDSRQ